jgi:acetolactate synthase regulatory subunit
LVARQAPADEIGIFAAAHVPGVLSRLRVPAAEGFVVAAVACTLAAEGSMLAHIRFVVTDRSRTGLELRSSRCWSGSGRITRAGDARPIRPDMPGARKIAD